MTILAYTLRLCRTCRRQRTHYRTGATWVCIGKAPWRVAARGCGVR
jgi:hypothetical protein